MEFSITIGLSRFFKEGNSTTWGNSTLLALNVFVLLIARTAGGGRLAWLIAFTLICCNSLLAWVGNTRRQRMILDVPTSRIASAAQGYVELIGHIDPQLNVTLPAQLSQTPCVWYRYQVEEKDSDDDWRIVDSGSSEQSFVLRDASGSCIIDPRGAEITTAHKDVWTEYDRRYTEYLLLADDELYALGEFTTRMPDTSAKTFRREVSELLAQWKTQRTDLHRRFDINQDGEIDLQEWEQVRLAAEAEIKQQHLVRATEAPQHHLRKPQQQPYLLSNLGHQPLSQRYRRWAWAHLGVFLLGCGGLAFWALR